MENVLNRRMFMRPVMAAEGVYMPTIEQIMNFYGGDFTDDGRPVDMEGFEKAIEIARKAEAAGLFPGEGEPIDNYFVPSRKVKNFVKDQGVKFYEPTGGYFERDSSNIFGKGDYRPGEKTRNFLKDLYSIPARKEYADSRVEADKIKEEADTKKQNFIDAMEATKDFQFPGKEQVDVEQGFVEEETPNKYVEELKEMVKFPNKTAGVNVGMSLADQAATMQEGMPRKELNEKEIAAINMRNYLREYSDSFGQLDPKEVENLLSKVVSKNVGLKDINSPLDEGGFNRGDYVEGGGATTTPGYENFASDMLNKYYDRFPEQRRIQEPGIENVQGEGGIFAHLPFYEGITDIDFTDNIKRGAVDDQGGSGWNQRKFTINPEGKILALPYTDEVGAEKLAFPGLEQKDTITSKEDIKKEIIEKSGESTDKEEIIKDTTTPKDERQKTIDEINEMIDTGITTKEKSTDKKSSKDERFGGYDSKEEQLLNESKLKKKWIDFDFDDYESEEYLKEFDINGDGEIGFLEVIQAEIMKKKVNKYKKNVLDKYEKEYTENLTKDAERYDDSQVPMDPDDVEKLDKAEAEAEAGGVGKDSEEAAAAAAETSTSKDVSETKYGGFSKEIADAAAQAGFSFSDMIGDGSSKDNDALEMIMYGLRLATTPGDFQDAAAENAMLYLNNKIKRNYKTAAAKAALKKDIFLKMLEGNIELKKYMAKEQYEEGKKPFDESKYYDDKERDGMIANWAMTNYKLDLEGAEPGTAEYGILLAMRDEITNVASEYKKEGKSPPANVTDLAWGRVNERFGIIPGDGGIFEGIPLLQNFFKTDAKAVAKVKVPVISVAKFEEIQAKYPNMRKEDLIAVLKNGVEINGKLTKFNTELIE